MHQLGRSAVYNIDEVANVNQAVAVFRVKRDFDRSYISYYIQLDETQKTFTGIQSESARLNLSLQISNCFNLDAAPSPSSKKSRRFCRRLTIKSGGSPARRSCWSSTKKASCKKSSRRKFDFRQADGSDYQDWQEKRLGGGRNCWRGYT